ncbi:unnamed protein product, partial [Closterium sp. NIES-54]
MDVWGPARVSGEGHERYFLLVVDDYSRYTTVFPLRRKGEVTEVLIDWIRGARRQLSESFGSDLPVLRLHSDRGGKFSSDLLRAFCRAEGISQTFTLPASPQQNGIAEHRIGMVMDVARTSMIHAAAPHFLWLFAVHYAAHQINLQPCVSLPETTLTLRWTGKVGDAFVFRVWGSRAFARDTSADKLSSCAVPCVFLGFPPDAPGWQFYHPTTRRVLSSQDVTFNESVSYYRLFPYRTASLPPPPLFLAPGAPLVDPLPPQGSAPSGVSQVDPVEPVEVAVNSSAKPAGAGPGGAEPGGAEPERVEPGGAEPWGAESGGAEHGGAQPEHDLDYDAILAAMYALSTSDEGDCYLCLLPDLGGGAAAVGACEAAALGASASAAPGAGESALSGTASAQVFHTFTLDSSASRSFFRDRTTLTPLSRPVAVSLADPSGGPVLASFSTVLPCPAAPSGSLSGLYLPSFSTNLVSGADPQDQGVDQFTPAGQRVTHCTCARMGRHLATFTRRPGSSLYTLSNESPPVSASSQVAASSQVFAAVSGSGPESAPCSCRLLSHQTLLWHHHLGHPSLPRLRGMASRVL